jgi:hypothetical protein
MPWLWKGVPQQARDTDRCSHCENHSTDDAGSELETLREHQARFSAAFAQMRAVAKEATANATRAGIDVREWRDKTTAAYRRRDECEAKLAKIENLHYFDGRECSCGHKHCQILRILYPRAFESRF